MSFARGMRWVATGALTATLALVAATGASAASSGPVWGPPVSYGGAGGTETVFLSISCLSVGNCVAVGQSELGGGEGVVAAESGGSWGPTAIVTELPSGHATSNDASLDSVSCTSATSCVAVGDYENSSNGTEPMVVPIAVSGTSAIPEDASEVTLPSAPSSASARTAALDGVSCESAGNCTAVGYYKDASEDVAPMTAVPGVGAWDASEVTTYPTAPSSETVALTAISCPGSGACEAVGNYDSAKDLYPWSVEVNNGQAGTGESVTLPKNFVAIEASAIPTEGLGSMGLTSISCPSAGVCTAAGSYPTISGSSGALSAVAVPIANGAPGGATELSGVAADNFIVGIWCSDASDCAVAGSSLTSVPAYNGIVASETAGAWSALAKLANDDEPIQLVTSMTCAAPGRCVAAGIAETDVGGGIATFFANSVPALSLSTTSLAGATVGQPYSATLQATGGTGAYSWSISDGSLPTGLSLNAATGVISGTPTTAGQSSFAAGVNDPGPPSQTSDDNLSIDVAPAAPPPPTLPPAAKVSVAYVTTHGGKATVVLTCSGAPCAGRLEIVGVEHLKGAKATAVIAKAHKKKGRASKKTITLASGSYAISAGGKQVVTLTLSRAASKLLAGLHSMSADLDVTPLGAKSPAVVKKLKFKATKAKKHKTHKTQKKHKKK